MIVVPKTKVAKAEPIGILLYVIVLRVSEAFQVRLYREPFRQSSPLLNQSASSQVEWKGIPT